MSRMEKLTTFLHNRVRRLLNMEYKPAEIAAELAIDVRLIRDCLKMGCPARYDKTGHAWINGKDFKSWVMTNTPQRKGKTAQRGELEFYCLPCKQYFTVKEITRTVKRGRLDITYAIAPCGHNVTKIKTKSEKAKE